MSDSQGVKFQRSVKSEIDRKGNKERERRRKREILII